MFSSLLILLDLISCTEQVNHISSVKTQEKMQKPNKKAEKKVEIKIENKPEKIKTKNKQKDKSQTRKVLNSTANQRSGIFLPWQDGIPSSFSENESDKYGKWIADNNDESPLVQPKSSN